MKNQLIQVVIGALAIWIVLFYIIPLIPSIAGIPIGSIVALIVLIIAAFWLLRVGGVE